MQLVPDLHGLDLPIASTVVPPALEEDSLLSTSRQRAQSTIAALTAPPELSDVPGMYASFGGEPQRQLQGGRCSPLPWLARTRSLPQQHLQPMPMPGQLPPYQPPPGPQQLPLLQAQQPGGMQQAPYQPGQLPQFGAMFNAGAGKQLVQQPFAPQQHHAPSPPMPLSSGPMLGNGLMPGGGYERPALLQPQAPPPRYVPEAWPGFALPPMQPPQQQQQPHFYQPPAPALAEPADESQKHWGADELKQLLEVLGEAAPGRQLAALQEADEGCDAGNKLAVEGLQTASSGVLGGGGGAGKRYQLLGTQMAPVPVRGPTTCL